MSRLDFPLYSADMMMVVMVMMVCVSFLYEDFVE
jgi:hypothetical protein